MSTEPALRFPEFEGEWEEKKLGDILKVKGRRNRDRRFGPEHVLSVSGDVGVVNQIEHLGRSYAGADVGEYHVLEPGDVVYTKSPLKANPFGIIRVNFGEPGIVSTLYAVYEVRDGHSSEFVSRYFESDDRTNDYLMPLVNKGAKNDMKISNERVLIDSVRFPKPNEQSKIASFLGTVDARIAAAARERSELERFKVGLLQALFSRTLRFTHDDGGAFPEWEEQRLGDVATIVGGGTPETNVEAYWNGGIAWFSPTELKAKYLTKSARTISAEGLRSSSAKLLPVGTLLLSTRATVGDVSIAAVECATNQGFQSLIVRPPHHNEFWYYWAVRNKEEFLKRAGGSTFLEISKSEVVKVPALVPHPNEQAKIANALAAFDRRLDLAMREETALRRFKAGLLQQMFA